MEKNKKTNHRINGGALIPIGTAGAKRYYQVNANNPSKTDSVIVGNKLAVDNGEVVEVKGNTVRVVSADLGTTNLMANLMKNNPIDKAFNMAYNTQETLKNNIGMNDDGTMKANKGGKTKLNLYPRRGIVLGSSPLVTLLNRMTRNHITNFTKSPFIPKVKLQGGGEEGLNDSIQLDSAVVKPNTIPVTLVTYPISKRYPISHSELIEVGRDSNNNLISQLHISKGSKDEGYNVFCSNCSDETGNFLGKVFNTNFTKGITTPRSLRRKLKHAGLINSETKSKDGTIRSTIEVF